MSLLVRCTLRTESNPPVRGRNWHLRGHHFETVGIGGALAQKFADARVPERLESGSLQSAFVASSVTGQLRLSDR
jgi:hypothetical protein